MKVLGISAIGDVSVGLILDKREVEINIRGASALRTLFFATKAIMDEASLSLKDLDAICVVAGPGSFTGARIGVCVAKAFYFVKKIPVFLVDTLEALAMGAKELHFPYLCPMIDAKKRKVFAAIYRNEETLIKETDILFIEPEGIKKYIKGRTAFFGDGARLYEERIKKIKNVEIAPSFFDNIRGVVIARMGKKLLMQGETPKDISNLSPIYIREADARPKD